jgi:segregation and condensation protein A
VLKEELELADVHVAQIVLTAINAPHFSRKETDLAAAGEFLVLIAALLDLKARALFPDEEAELDDLDPEGAAAELAERLALYRRFKAAAAALEQRLEAESDRFFRLGPAPLAPVPVRALPAQDPQALATALRSLAAEPPEPSLRHLTLTFPPLSLFLDRFRSLLRRRRRFDFDREVGALSRVEQAVAFLALLELRKSGELRIGQTAPFEPITAWSTTTSA